MQAWRRVAPSIPGGPLLLTVAIAVVEGGRWRWLTVAAVALTPALLPALHRARSTRP